MRLGQDSLVALGARLSHPICPGYSGLSAGSGRALLAIRLILTKSLVRCIQLHKFIPSQREDLIKIHLLALKLTDWFDDTVSNVS